MDRPIADHPAQAGDLVDLAVDELLPAETGVHRHHQHHVAQVQQVFDRLDRGAGVQRDPGPFARRTDRLQGAVRMRPGLDMGGDHVGPRLGIGLDIGVDRRDHQMHVHDRLDMRAERLDRRGAEGQVRHEMPVHHVDMDPVGALRLDGADLGPEIGEIGGQDRWGDLDRAVEIHGALQSVRAGFTPLRPACWRGPRQDRRRRPGWRGCPARSAWTGRRRPAAPAPR